MDIIPFKGREPSGTYQLNLLDRAGKCYLMDNHLAAAWCWLQEVNLNKQYHLFHIDQHYDLSTALVNQWAIQMKAMGVDYKLTPIDQLLEIQMEVGQDFIGKQLPLLRWDNYLTLLDILYPGLWDSMSFATHKKGDLPTHYKEVIHEHEFYDLTQNLGYWLASDNGIKSVLNIDIDYFFLNHGDSHIRVFDDAYIRSLCKEIRSAWDHITVFTLCLSPECCGGWKPALEIVELISTALKIPWNIKQIK